MKFSVEKSDLVEMAALAIKIAPKKSLLPICQNVRVTAENDTAMFGATNLGVYFQYRINAEVEISGCKTIPIHDLAKILKQSQPGRVTIEAENDEQITIETGEDSYTLETQDSEDFPCPPVFEPTVKFTLHQAELARLLNDVLYAVPEKDTRKMLNGIFFDADGETLNLVGTNGRQAAWGKMDLKSTPFQAILPRSLLVEANRNLTKMDSAFIKIGETLASIKIGPSTYTAKLLEGIYPKYRMVWPTTVNYSFSANLEDLKSLLKRACLMADERLNCVILAVEDGHLEATSKRYDKGTFQGSMAIESNSARFTVAFNVILLLDTLANLKGKTVKMEVQHADGPVLFSIPGSAASHLVMPVKLKENGEPKE